MLFLSLLRESTSSTICNARKICKKIYPVLLFQRILFSDTSTHNFAGHSFTYHFKPQPMAPPPLLSSPVSASFQPPLPDSPPNDGTSRIHGTGPRRNWRWLQLVIHHSGPRWRPSRPQT